MSAHVLDDALEEGCEAELLLTGFSSRLVELDLQGLDLHLGVLQRVLELLGRLLRRLERALAARTLLDQPLVLRLHVLQLLLG